MRAESTPSVVRERAADEHAAGEIAAGVRVRKNVVRRVVKIRNELGARDRDAVDVVSCVQLAEAAATAVGWPGLMYNTTPLASVTCIAWWFATGERLVRRIGATRRAPWSMR
jgi:hypothetical protein